MWIALSRTREKVANVKNLMLIIFMTISFGLTQASAQMRPKANSTADVLDILSIVNNIAHDPGMSESEKATALSQALASTYLASQYAKFSNSDFSEPFPVTVEAWNLLFESVRGLVPRLSSYKNENQDIRSYRGKVYAEISDCLRDEDQAAIPTCGNEQYWSGRHDLWINGKRISEGAAFYSEIMHFTNAELLLMQAPLCKLVQQGLPKQNIYELVRLFKLFSESITFGLHARLLADTRVLKKIGRAHVELQSH